MSEQSRDAAIAALLQGEVVIVPTDTVYGLAAAADNSAAVTRMYALKERPVDVKVAVLVADQAQAEQFVDLGVVGRALASAFWPGPLTIVAPRHVIGSLHAGDNETLGVRCPADPLLCELAAAVGPIAATSANRHGEPTATTAGDAADAFPAVEVIVDGGPRPGSASTVVSVVEPVLEILREGPVTAADIDAVVGDDS